MEFLSVERSLQDRIEKLVEKQAEDAKAREVLEALVLEAGRSMSNLEEEHRLRPHGRCRA